MIVHLLDPRGVDAVQWGPGGGAPRAAGRWCSRLCRAARGSGPGRSRGGRPVVLEGRDTGGELVAPVHGEGAAVWGPGLARLSSETSTARLEGALPPTGHHLASTIGVDLSAGTVPEDHRRGAPRGRPEGGARGLLEAFLPRDLPRARSAPMAPRRPPGCPARSGCIAVGAAVDGLLSTRGIWVQADEGASLTGAACAPNRRDRGVAGRA